jgi:hypothetical protein
MSIQSIYPLHNLFLYKNVLCLINSELIRDETILTYFKKTYNYTPLDNSFQTLVINIGNNNSEIYHLSIHDNIFMLYSIDGKFFEPTITLLNTISDIICLMIKSKYNSYFLANLLSVKLCVYLPNNSKVPFGFVKKSENNITNLFGTQLLHQNLSLYIKNFEFNEKYELKNISFENLIDYTDMIKKFISQPVISAQSLPTFQPATNNFPIFGNSMKY